MKKLHATMIAGLLCLLPMWAQGADETVALAAGGTLRLDKKGLHLLDGAGRQRAALPMRAEQLDVRGSLAVVRNAGDQHALLVRVDAAGGKLAVLGPLPVQNFGLESLCLFRDRQGVQQLFIAGRDGQAEQWLLDGDTPRLVRKLALPPNSESCRVDDARHRLLVNEAGVGTWAYEADSEAPPSRRLLPNGKAGAKQAPEPIVIVPHAQTEPVAQLGDAADDPAIWAHPADPSQSRVLGTNKKQGLMVYDLQGRQTQFLPVGRLNNVDLRQGVAMEGQAVDLAVASQRDDNTVVLFGIDGAGTVAELARIPSGLDKIYGICLYQPPGGGLDAIVNDKDGRFHQLRIGRSGGAYNGKLVRQFKLASQPEGCVADDARRRLFLGEEKRGVWTMAADAEQPATLMMVLPVGKAMHADVEGMAIYYGAGADYLVVSSQGDSSYTVLDALPPFRVRGRFKVGFNLAAGIDGTAETDGLDVTSKNLGGAYAKGLMVIQDGYKRLPDGPQNFKYLRWEDVAGALKLR